MKLFRRHTAVEPIRPPRPRGADESIALVSARRWGFNPSFPSGPGWGNEIGEWLEGEIWGTLR